MLERYIRLIAGTSYQRAGHWVSPHGYLFTAFVGTKLGLSCSSLH